tara:strand:- start:180 stop:1079 length:900 start_codon:yes stop_codon:yes gene_type:complete
MTEKLKVYIPTLNRNGEYYMLIVTGFRLNENVELVNSKDECDYIILDFRHLMFGNQTKTENIIGNDYNKTIMIDYRDKPYDIFDKDFLLYFKRSVVNKGTLTFCDYSKYNFKVIPYAYAIKHECSNFKNDLQNNRPIDVACLFDPIHAIQKRRKNIANYLKNNLKKLNIYIGEAENNKKGTPEKINMAYFNIMLNSKIVVTCNPDNWEGDYRLFEALACGCLILVDKMLTPTKNPLLDGIHLVYYDRNNMDELMSKIDYYLKNEEERLKIAQQGYEYGKKYHSCISRIDEVIEEIKKIN